MDVLEHLEEDASFLADLIALARHSDAVLYVVLALSGRHIVEEADE